MLSLGKEAESAVSQQVFAPIEKLGQWGQRTRGDDIDLTGEIADRILDPCGVNPDRCAGNPRCMTQKRAFAGIALDEIDLAPALLCQANADHQPGKTAS